MSTLNELESTTDIPELQCSECDVIFGIYWNRNGYTEHIDYCPFCGDGVEEIIYLGD